MSVLPPRAQPDLPPQKPQARLAKGLVTMKDRSHIGVSRNANIDWRSLPRNGLWGKGLRNFLGPVVPADW